MSSPHRPARTDRLSPSRRQHSNQEEAYASAEEHVPVLLSETIEGLALTPNATCIDGTVGGAGHAEALLTATAPTGRLLGLDADASAIARAWARLAPFGERAVLVQANFRHITSVAVAHGFAHVNAVVLDLGISAFELAPERGFSLRAAGPLDMRMDPGTELTADEIVNEWSQEQLADILYRYGEEPRSRRIARAVVAARPLRTTTELAEVVSRTVGRDSPSGPGRRRIHPATRVFQALRIRVNDELGALAEALPAIVSLLVPAGLLAPSNPGPPLGSVAGAGGGEEGCVPQTRGGRFAVITFHSLEDRVVKQFIQRETRDCLCPPGVPVCTCAHRATLRAVTRKPIRPSEDEIRANPRSRSAKLRIAERLPALAAPPTRPA